MRDDLETHCNGRPELLKQQMQGPNPKSMFVNFFRNMESNDNFRETHNVYLSIHTHTHTHMYIYIYIYIYDRLKWLTAQMT